jgi:hypothetical protein
MLLTIAEVARRKKTTKYSVRRWIKSGLRARRLGSQFVVEARDLEAFRPRKAGHPRKTQ